MLRRRRALLPVACGLTAGVLGAALAASVIDVAKADTTPIAQKKSTAADRKDVSITIYNQNFGLVRETREVDVGVGKVSLEVGDVASTVEPPTVSIRDSKAKGAKPADPKKPGASATGFQVLEQNFRYDLLTPGTLLEKFVGQKIRAYRFNEKSGKEDGYDATLMSVVNERPVLEINGEVTFDFPGRLAFGGVPTNLISKPTLVWLLDVPVRPSADAKEPKANIEMTYLAGGMNWSADYVLVLDATDTKADLNGWVTLRNQSGASYQNATLKLVAGDVNRVTMTTPADDFKPAEPKMQAATGGFREEGLFEYHLYTLERPTDVLDKEQKQVTLLEAKGITPEKKYIFYGAQYGYRGEYGEAMGNQKVGVYIDLQNSTKNGLGMPLPKGVLRVYKTDASGARQFVGEDSIDHTPKDERVRVKMGDAFDVVGSHKQTSYKVLGRCTIETAWEIELRNHKDSAVKVEAWEPIGGEWTIEESSQPSNKKDAQTFEFDVDVPANGKKTVTYKVRLTYC